MTGRRRYVAPKTRYNGDGINSAQAIRHQQQMLLLQQQQQQMMQRQQLPLPLPPQPHQQQQQQQRQQNSQVQKASVTEAEKSSKTGDSSMAVAFSIPPSVGSPSVPNVTNLDRLMKSISPSIPLKNSSEVNSMDSSKQEVDSHPFYCLEDLWESFNEWSVYGAGVPLLLYGKDPIVQYYVPYLSGIQLYKDPLRTSPQLRGSEKKSDTESSTMKSSASSSTDWRGKSVVNSNMTQQLSMLSLGDESVVSSYGCEADTKVPFFQYLEHVQPYFRQPLTDKISLLASQFPELSNCRSCDLLPTSWICVAWYPIYRIPVGPTLKDLEASFLTFYSLSTQSRSDFPPMTGNFPPMTGNFPPQFRAANTTAVQNNADPTKKFSLPVFGLASYKFKGSIMSPSGPHECEQERCLLKAAEDWLQNVKVILPDFQFFISHYTHRR